MDRRERLDDPVEALRLALEGAQADIWTALPGIVTGYDPAAMTVTVQPAVSGTLEDGRGRRRPLPLPLLVDVPVVFPSGGGFTLTFPVAAGDECLVVFSARCIDGWWQSGGVQPPAERRLHDLSDGVAILGIRSQPRVLSPAADASAVELRCDDGDDFVRIAPDGAITAQATESLVLRAPSVRIEGALSVTGVSGGPTAMIVDGTMQVSGDVAAGNISLAGHVHGGVEPGSAETGVPK